MMSVLFANLRRWWHIRDGKSDLRALAGKWPDTAHWMARFANQTRDTGPIGRNGAQPVTAPKCDADRGR